MRPWRSAASIGSPTATGVSPRPLTRAEAGVIEGTLADVGAVDGGDGTLDAADEATMVVAGEESSSVHDVEAAAPTTTTATDPMERPRASHDPPGVAVIADRDEAVRSERSNRQAGSLAIHQRSSRIHEDQRSQGVDLGGNRRSN